MPFNPGPLRPRRSHTGCLESDLPNKDASGWRETAPAKGAKAGRCLAPSLPDVGPRPLSPPAPAPHLQPPPARGKPHLGNKLLIGWPGGVAGQSKPSLTPRWKKLRKKGRKRNCSPGGDREWGLSERGEAGRLLDLGLLVTCSRRSSALQGPAPRFLSDLGVRG
ncbi:hypothetical protein P7K49_035729 [Saguinus oedipus]|uniref:Uncharacterized protein n=1 Tax=Saguinus oedipus TaxID=9490 RepID=A0ABQ9TNP9_SAGOE|nr:hypothetical protein P7K49_035729 [Saguinus oedipus]